jgi:maltose-binding protein MalE
MVKIEVFDNEQVKTEQVLRLKLKEDTNGDVDLIAVDEHGAIVSGGVLLTIRPRGTVKRQRGVSDNLGLQIGFDGKIVEDD